MSSLFKVLHKTSYHYSKPVYLSPHIFRLRPAGHSPANITDYKIDVSPASHTIHWQQDAFSNFLSRVNFIGEMNAMSVEVAFTAELTPFNPLDFYIESYAMFFPFDYDRQLRKGLCAYFEIVENGPLLTEFVSELKSSKANLVEHLIMINKMVFERIDYTIRDEPGILSCEVALAERRGSCRDSAWLLVQLLRHLNLASRFVSGYLLETGVEIEDRVSLHAWAEVFIPGAGWIGLDATTGLFTGAGHIPLACSADPADAAPVSGLVTQCESTLDFISSVERL